VIAQFIFNIPSFSTNKYRYGFNGMEKDDDLAGGKKGMSYDFGARLYNPGLGRWLAIDSDFSVYPSLSPYSFAANSPLIIVDPDGNLLRDSKGNLIVVDAGGPSVARTVALTKRIATKGGNTQAFIAVVHFKEVYVIANNGTKIKAFIRDNSKPVEYFIEAYGKDGQVVEQMAAPDKLVNNWRRAGKLGGVGNNCHGVSLAGGELQIPNSKELTNTFGDETEFETLDTKDGATVVTYKQDGDVTHSKKVNSDGTFTYSDGGTEVKTGSQDEPAITKKYGTDTSFKKEKEKRTDIFDNLTDKSIEGLNIISNGGYEGRVAEQEYNQQLNDKNERETL
jgi:RHS repeat-associated protein